MAFLVVGNLVAAAWFFASVADDAPPWLSVATATIGLPAMLAPGALQLLGIIRRKLRERRVARSGPAPM